MLSYYRLLNMYFVNFMHVLFDRVLPDLSILHSMSHRM